MIRNYKINYEGTTFKLSFSAPDLGTHPTVTLTRENGENLQKGDDSLLQDIHNRINAGNSAVKPMPRLEYDFDEGRLEAGRLESITAEIKRAGSNYATPEELSGIVQTAISGDTEHGGLGAKAEPSVKPVIAKRPHHSEIAKGHDPLRPVSSAPRKVER